MKILIISPKNRTVYNFRGELIRELIQKGHEITVTGPDKTDEEKIKELGAKFIDIPLDKNSINPIKDIRYAKALKRLIKSLCPEVVFCYTVKPIIYGTYAAKKCGVKRIVPMITGVGYVFNSDSIKARVLRNPVCFLYKKTLKNIKNVIFQNPDDMELFCDKKLVSESQCALVNGSGVNMQKFAKAPLPEKTVFFMLSRLLKSKGVTEYLKSAEQVKKLYPDVEFHLLGDFEDMSDALSKEFVEDFEKRGIIKRFSECENVVPYYRSCSVFVLPSYGEGTPRSVLEAMSCGRAIITTDAPGCRETVKDGVNGFLVPPKDCKALSEKMITLINSPSLVEEMGQASYEYCKEKFEVGKVNKTMLEMMGIK